ncbi:MAG TPA: glycosyltransferase family 8 protein [Pirellulaceae bacterium]|nr:glycosyltransferase family 8 protein [Pirellulaceae bacterium]HMO90942.1 glycosyltransferase family 8 protein [Pirellulaceae bacterium]HMP69841.1 glycosyltransferase family 8 protein [Pirellulaceae bacterium]
MISVVCAADDAYAMPLAVTLRSLGDHLSPTTFARVFVLDGGISELNWMAIKESLAGLPLDVTSVVPERDRVNSLPTSHHITHTAYFRLLTADLLPDDIDKVIYLDADLLIKDDVSQIWQIPLNNAYCAATVDIACPYIDARLGSANFRRAAPYLATICPVRNYRDLGLDGSQEYFNSGVMILNLNRWRQENLIERFLKCLHDNAKHVWCWDQYALNVVFAGEWLRLAPRWNQGAHAFEYPTEKHVPIDPQEWREMIDNPAIVHFTTEFKPWQFNSDHPRSELFYDGLAATMWRGWQPTKPAFRWRKWFDRQGAHVVKRVTYAYRKVTTLWA